MNDIDGGVGRLKGMRKGDARRRAILDVAERLFYEKGYEHTSVQDVLDAMSMSKGGFYHHFESKISLLEAICEQRAETTCGQCEKIVDECDGSAVEKLNLLFERGFFFGQDSMDFIGLMVRMIYREGCAQLKDTLQRSQVRLYLPLMKRIIREGAAEQLFYTPNADAMARILLLMNNCMTDEVASVIAHADDGEVAMQILDLIGAYRRSIELLLNAPYGSVQLMELEKALSVIRSTQLGMAS